VQKYQNPTSETLEPHPKNTSTHTPMNFWKAYQAVITSVEYYSNEFNNLNRARVNCFVESG
jgi:hypothetical protein